MSEITPIAKQANRNYSMDILRILAILIVILFHVSYPFWDNAFSSNQWIKALFPDAISRWGVPVFVMISGAFMLQKEVSLKVLWTKYIKRLAILLVCWNVIYHIPDFKSMSFSVKEIIAIFLFFRRWLSSLVSIHVDKYICNYSNIKENSRWRSHKICVITLVLYFNSIFLVREIQYFHLFTNVFA